MQTGLQIMKSHTPHIQPFSKCLFHSAVLYSFIYVEYVLYVEYLNLDRLKGKMIFLKLVIFFFFFFFTGSREGLSSTNQPRDLLLAPVDLSKKGRR